MTSYLVGNKFIVRWKVLLGINLLFLLQTFHEELEAREQKPQGGGTVQRTPLERSTSQEEEKARKAKLAQERRAKIMAQMSALQKAFIKENAELLASMETEGYVVNPI